MENEDKEKYIEWGKLGGRPRKSTKRDNKIVFRVDEEEFVRIKSLAESRGMTVSNYSRTILSEKKIPDYESNKELIKYAHNFALISNYMKMGIFNSEEGERLTREIEKVIKEIKNFVDDNRGKISQG